MTPEERLEECARRESALRAALGDFVWLGNNLHNAGTLTFRQFYETALIDARAALGLPATPENVTLLVEEPQ